MDDRLSWKRRILELWPLRIKLLWPELWMSKDPIELCKLASKSFPCCCFEEENEVFNRMCRLDCARRRPPLRRSNDSGGPMLSKDRELSNNKFSWLVVRVNKGRCPWLRLRELRRVPGRRCSDSSRMTSVLRRLSNDRALSMRFSLLIFFMSVREPCIRSRELRLALRISITSMLKLSNDRQLPVNVPTLFVRTIVWVGFDWPVDARRVLFCRLLLHSRKSVPKLSKEWQLADMRSPWLRSLANERLPSQRVSERLRQDLLGGTDNSLISIEPLRACRPFDSTILKVHWWSAISWLRKVGGAFMREEFLFCSFGR